MDATRCDWGKYANNMKTLLIHKNVEVQPGKQLEFPTFIPGLDNFPHKSRCLIMIDTLTVGLIDGSNTTDTSTNLFASKNPEMFSLPTIGVSVEGLGVMNSYDNINNQNSLIGCCPVSTVKVLSSSLSKAMSFVYQNNGTILSCGVLCQSPFGKSFTIRFHDFTIAQSPNESNLIKNLNTTVSNNYLITMNLKLLYLDNDDMKHV
eukprot:SAG22_NODE_424_length_10663_cov_93.402026_17_plen_205_part_00